MSHTVSAEAMNTLFRDARTPKSWREKDIDESLLKEIVELMKWAPTSANCWPLRVTFARSVDAKKKLASFAMDANQERILKASVTAIFAYDSEFYEKLPQLMPAAPHFREVFASSESLAQSTAFRNSSLQSAYFIIAARALGLDCGPMSGFSNDDVDGHFFPDGKRKSNFLCCLGYGEQSTLYARAPRPDFDEVCEII
jgi:3-hydroxypropanoate dehydrogenase